MLPAMTTLNFTQFIALLLGSEVKFSFTTFFAAQPMPAAIPVRVAASITVFTSLLSDIVVCKEESLIFNSFFLAPLFSVEQQWQAQAQALQAQVVAVYVVGQPFCCKRP